MRLTCAFWGTPDITDHVFETAFPLLLWIPLIAVILFRLIDSLSEHLEIIDADVS